MTYRADIDGLRALAVLMVVFFHYAAIDQFSGYIGVDIFFVISGFLITGIISKELERGDFSIGRFYERRIRRIMPALSVVLVTSILAAFWLFLPAENIAFAKSLIGASLFSSNFVFWAEKGYFDMEAELKPLLHTWSLAIEEQFYIIFPLLMMAGYRFFRRHVQAMVVVLGLASFLCNVALIHCDMAGTAFYMIVARAWELMLGSWVALYNPATAPRPKILSVSLWVGVFFIAAAFIGKVNPNDFPGLYALLPTVGAALIIYAGQYRQGHVIQTFLSSKPMVGIGKISYSLYLWHWPLYVFALYYGLGDITVGYKILLAGLCFILAYLSWRFVEQPARHYRAINRSTLFALTAILSFALAGCGVYMLFQKGITTVHDADILALTDASIGLDFPDATMPEADRDYSVAVMGLEKGMESASVALWGDSHATAISPAIHELLVNSEKTGLLIRNNTCFVLTAQQQAYRENDCVARTEAVMEFLQSHPSIHTVVIVNRWAVHLNDLQKKIGEKHKIDLSDLTPERQQEMIAWRINSLQGVIHGLQKQGKKVVFIAAVPEVVAGSDNIPSLAARIHQQKLSIDLRPTTVQFLEHEKFMMPVYMALEKEPGVRVIWPHKTLCDEKLCDIMEGNRLLYYDDDHLSTYGAQTLTPLFKGLF